MVADALARRWGVEDQWKLKDRARQALVRERGVVLVEPLSFMNDSGIPARAVAAWYRVPAERMLVVYDDMDLPFGKLRLREKGSSGGHNGIKSLIAHFGEDFPRLKIGIGRGRESDAIDRVLGTFSDAERPDLERIIDASAEACGTWLERASPRPPTPPMPGCCIRRRPSRPSRGRRLKLSPNRPMTMNKD